MQQGDGEALAKGHREATNDEIVHFSCITSHPRTLGSRQNKVFHEVNSCQWRTSVIQGLKKSVSLRVTSNLYLDEYRFRYLALDFKQGLDCITGLFNILI